MRSAFALSALLLAAPCCGPGSRTSGGGRTEPPAVIGELVTSNDSAGIHFVISPGIPTVPATAPDEDSVWSDNSDGDTVSVILAPAMQLAVQLTVDVSIRRFRTDSGGDIVDEGPGATRLVRWMGPVSLDLSTVPEERGGRRIMLLLPRGINHRFGLTGQHEYVDRVLYYVRLPDGRSVTRSFMLLPSI